MMEGNVNYLCSLLLYWYETMDNILLLVVMLVRRLQGFWRVWGLKWKVEVSEWDKLI